MQETADFTLVPFVGLSSRLKGVGRNHTSIGWLGGIAKVDERNI